MVAFIDRSLSLEKPVPFGYASLHRNLDSSQLSALLKLHPKLRSNEEFNLAYLTKLRPGDETEFQRDPRAHAAHLEQCRDHVLTLPPALISLKAHVLHHHLRMQASLGRYPLDDLLAYLALPQQRHSILREPEEKSTVFINTDADFSAATGCKAVGDDTVLIESLLHHFLAKTDSPKDFADYVPEKILTRLHAQARLLAGENPARWGTALSPAEFKSLQEESRIAFAPGSPDLLAASDAVNLTLNLKNTPELLVRIYELDLPAHFARHRSEPDVDIHHDEPSVIRDYLENSPAVTQLGQWLDSPLLEVRPRVHHDWRTLEFDPLVNARAHRFTGKSRLTHQAAREHYHAFLDQLAWKATLDASDHLTLCAFLFLQDRIEEALERFAKIDPQQLSGRLHYDYLHSVALFHQENPSAAREIAARNLPALPPGLWRDRFQTVIEQADEIVALAATNETATGAGEDSAPQLDLIAGDGGRLVIRHRSLERTTLRLFSVDLEVLFSKDPFLKGDAGSGTEPAIRPNHLLEVQLQPDVNETSIELPENLRQGSLLAAAESGNTRLLRVLDSRAIDLRLLLSSEP